MNGVGELKRFGIRPNNRSEGSLELRLRCLVRTYQAILAELRSKTGLPWKQRLAAWKRGFSSASWVAYNLPENDPGWYVADLRAALNGYKINGFFNPIISNKLVFSRLLSAHQVPHPPVVSSILRGQLFEEDAAFDPDLARALSRTLQRYPRQVFRPTWAGKGEGVFFLFMEDDGLKLNGHAVSMEQASTIISRLDRYIATEFQEQAAYAKKIFPGTSNTLRIMSLWDMDRGEPFIAAACHRFGSLRSGPTDNWRGGQGGICSPVDLKTSRLGPGVTLLSKTQMQSLASHPDSGELIEGVSVPGLKQCIDGILKTASRLPFCPMIGWDAIMTEEGFSILEANAQPALAVVQVHTPLLKDPRSIEFFRYWGLASRKQ